MPAEFEMRFKKLRQLVGSKSRRETSDAPFPYIAQPNIPPLHSRNLNQGTDVLLEGRRGLEVHVVWRPSWACDSACHCLCHGSTHGRSPEFLDEFLGILFRGYCGLPILRKRCDVSSCRRRLGLRFGMSYYFSGLVRGEETRAHFPLYAAWYASSLNQNGQHCLQWRFDIQIHS